jgi:hypothetical protein
VRPNEQERYPIPELELEVGLLDGWARYWYRGELLPLPAELLRDLEESHRQSDASRQRAEQAEQRTEQAEQRAEQERQMRLALEQELERLRSRGNRRNN